MGKTQKLIRTICEIGLFAALGFILDEIQGALSGSLFIAGGSIGFAMIAVLIIGYRRGGIAAISTGIIMGLIDMATKAYLLHPIQVLCDYILPYALVGVAGFLRPFIINNDSSKKRLFLMILGVTVGGILKLVSHYIAGVIWWADPEYFAWNLNALSPYLYCFIYNFAAVGPSIILCSILLAVLYKKAPVIFNLNKEDGEVIEIKNRKKEPYAFLSITLIAALAIYEFVDSLVIYIRSYKWKASSMKYSLDGDSRIIIIASIFAFVLVGILLYDYFTSRFSYRKMFTGLLFIFGFIGLSGVALSISIALEGESATQYRTWIAISLLISIICSAAIDYSKQLEKR